MRLNTKWYEEGDRLTTRERKLYMWIRNIAAVIFFGLLLVYTVFDLLEPTNWATVLACFIAGFVGVFGAALQNDVRVIRGVKWLREGETKHGLEPNSRSEGEEEKASDK